MIDHEHNPSTPAIRLGSSDAPGAAQGTGSEGNFRYVVESLLITAEALELVLFGLEQDHEAFSNSLSLELMYRRWAVHLTSLHALCQKLNTQAEDLHARVTLTERVT